MIEPRTQPTSATHDAAEPEQRLADDDGGKTDDDGADAGGDIGEAVGLGEQGAGDADQRVRQRHAGIDLQLGADALRARHARVGAGGAHGEAEVARQEPREQDDGDSERGRRGTAAAPGSP